MSLFLLQIPIEDIIKELLNAGQQDRSQLRLILIWAIIIMAINIASVIWNTVLQIRLKNAEKDIANYNIKQGKRINVHETIFEKFHSLTLFIPGGDINNFIQSVQVTQAFITASKLYIDNNSMAIFNKHLDYFRRLIIAPYQKDVRYEAEMLNEVANNFQNI